MLGLLKFVSENILKAGVTATLSNWQRKRVQFLNAFILFLFFFIPIDGIFLILAGHTQLGFFFLGYAVIAGVSIGANAIKQYNAGRLLIVVATGIYILIANFYTKSYLLNSQDSFSGAYLLKHFLPGIFTILFIAYDLKHERITLAILIIYNLLLMAGFDFLMGLMGFPGYSGQLGFLDNVFFITDTLSIAGQIVFLVSVNQNFEEKLLAQKDALADLNHEISLQNEELYQQQEELTTQKEYIERKNKQLEESNGLIKSSIMAAEMIQKAVLPSLEPLQDYFTEHLLFYRPKDIVSGDFYWIAQREEQLWIVAADCTGHGVPGAFMTLLAHNMLDKIINLKQAPAPAAALEMLDAEVRAVLRQQSTESRSGMDLTIALFKRPDVEGSIEVQFSGAKSYVYVVKGDVLQEFRGDRIFIGGARRDPSSTFSNHTLVLPKGSMIYMASDGYQDQNNVQRSSFGRNQLKHLLVRMATLPVTVQATQLQSMLQAHMNGTEQRDDILILGLRV